MATLQEWRTCPEPPSRPHHTLPWEHERHPLATPPHTHTPGQDKDGPGWDKGPVPEPQRSQGCAEEGGLAARGVRRPDCSRVSGSPVPSWALLKHVPAPRVLSKRPASDVRSHIPWQCGFSLEAASTHSSVLEHSQDVWEAGEVGNSCPGHGTRSCICYQSRVGLSRSRHPAHSLPGMRRLLPSDPTPMLYAIGQVVGSSKSAWSASKEAAGRVSKAEGRAQRGQGTRHGGWSVGRGQSPRAHGAEQKVLG